MSRVLSEEGYAVECARDGEAALARLAASDVDLVILDLMLPRVDGLDVCRRLRNRRGQEIYLPILMLTALARPEASLTAVSAE